MMQFLNKLNHWVVRAEEWILFAVVLFMVLLAFLQVILRNVLGTGIIWGDIFLRHLVLWVGFLGASIATRENRHINIDLLKRLLKGRSLRGMQVLIDAFCVFITFYLSLAGWNFVLQEKEFGGILFSNIPVWYFQIIIPVGFMLMGLRFALSALNTIFKTTPEVR